ncbi:MAG: cytochrome c1 [Janthinobacterium lividum]
MRWVFLAAGMTLAAPVAMPAWAQGPDHAPAKLPAAPAPVASPTVNAPAPGVQAPSAPAAAPVASQAQDHGHDEANIPKVNWSFNGPFGTYDRASMQRGFQVYKEVCANCHSMKLLSYRNLSGIGLNEAQVKAIAASVEVGGSTDDAGQPIDRPALPSDRFRSPFPNDKAARAANGGALPPDQSLIIKARNQGSDYVHALLNGYRDAPAGTTVPTGQYYNEYFPGHLLAMPPPLSDGQVTYADGTKATVEQMSSDVVQFLTWASSPEMEARKRLGVKAVLFLVFMTGLTYAVKRKIWKNVH